MATEQIPPEGTVQGNGAASSGGASSLSAEQRARVATAVQQRATAPQGGGREHADSMVYVWPHLVMIEFIASIVMTLSMVILSMVISAPLEGHANPDKTPNPSKAPWYFLNLQELLLHMHPALAGVIVPAGALALIAIIPYIDRDPRDMGKWAGTPKAGAVIWFTSIFTAVVLILEIFFDEFVGVKPLMKSLVIATNSDLFANPFLVDIFVPLIFMCTPIVLLVVLMKVLYGPLTTRDWMLCFFTGFFVSYIVLTISGTFFRGQGMHLYWPWDPHQIRVE